jgi:hypothetical protein
MISNKNDKIVKMDKIFNYKEYNNLFLKLNEDNCGPFDNVTAWNDTLLGRLINSTIRKSKIRIKLKTIDNLVTALEKTMSDLIFDVITTEENNKNLKKIQLSFLLNELSISIQKDVETDDEVEKCLDEVKNQTIYIIDYLNKEYSEFDGKKELLSILNELKEILLKVDETQSEEETNPEPTPGPLDGDGKKTLMNELHVSVGELENIVKEIDKEIKPGEETKKDDLGNDQNNKTPEGGQKPTDNDSNISNIGEHNSVVLKYYDLIKEDISISDKIKKFIEKLGDTLNRNLKLYSGIKVYREFLNLYKPNQDSYKELLIPCKNVINHLLNKSEGFIYRCSDYIIIKESKESIENEIEELEKNLKFVTESPITKKFDEKLKSITIEDIKKKLKDKKEELDKIKPNIDTDENVQGESPEPSKDDEEDESSTSKVDKIKKYWISVDIGRWIVDSKEFEKLNKETKNMKNKKLTIKNPDRVIEIVELFNKAYKIYTTQVIPTQRKGGTVSNKTFQEYVSLGGNIDPSRAGSSGGPYRNIKLFDKWERGVFDVIKNPDYQSFFRGEIELVTPSGKVVKDAGNHIIKYMNRMLNGDDMYRTGSSGNPTQLYFLNEYFGIKSLPSNNSNPISEIVQSNTKVANAIPDLEFSNSDIEVKLQDLAGTIFVAKNENEKNEKLKWNYYYIKEVKNDEACILFSRTFGFFKDYIPGNRTFKKGNLGEEIFLDKKYEDRREYMIKFAICDINKIFKNNKTQSEGENFEIEYKTIYGNNKNFDHSAEVKSEEKKSWLLKNKCFLVTKDGDKKIKLFKCKEIASSFEKKISDGSKWENLTKI